MAYRLTGAAFHGGASELIVRDGWFVAEAEGTAQELDLRGLHVFPGFGDAHVHFPTWAAVRRQVRLEGTRTLAEAVERVAAAARDVPPGGWLRGHGWRVGDWEGGQEPTKALLDAVAPGVPCALMSRDYHSLWLSSAALARADAPLQVPGGVVERDADGEPTGVLRERSAWAFRDRWSAPTRAEYLDAMRAALPVAAARGVTSVHDKDGWLGALDLFTELREAGELTLRVHQSLPAELAVGGELPEHAGDEWLRVGYLKAFMDGTLGSGTALRLDGSGVEITSTAQLAEFVRAGAAVGLPVAVHAIGDLANRNALDAFAATRDAWAPLGLRQRIEHAQLVDDADLPRFGALGVAASVQFSHAPSDRDVADDLWADVAHRAYPYGGLLRAGARLVNGSDAPVEELDPLAGLQAGIHRTLDDRPSWHPEHRLDPAAALDAIVSGPVWLAGDEAWRGRLAPGHAADLVVCDRDPRTDPLGTTVLATMAGGAWTFRDGV